MPGRQAGPPGFRFSECDDRVCRAGGSALDPASGPAERRFRSQSHTGGPDEIHRPGRGHRRRHRRLLDALSPGPGRLDRCRPAGARRADLRHHLALGRAGDQFRRGADHGRAEEPFDPALQRARAGSRLSDQLPSRRRRPAAGLAGVAPRRLPALHLDGEGHGGGVRAHRPGGMPPQASADYRRGAGRRTLGPARRRHRPGAALPGAGPAGAHGRSGGLPPHAGHRAHPETGRRVDRPHPGGRDRRRACGECGRIPVQRGRRDDGGKPPGRVDGAPVFPDRADPGDRGAGPPRAAAALPDRRLLLAAGKAGAAGRVLRAGLPDLGPGRDRSEFHQCALPERSGPGAAGAGERVPPPALPDRDRHPHHRQRADHLYPGRPAAGRADSRQAQRLVHHRAQGRARRGRRAWLAAGAADRPWRGGLRHLVPRPAPLHPPRHGRIHGAEGDRGLPERVPLPPPARAPPGGAPGQDHPALPGARGRRRRVRPGQRLGARQFFQARARFPRGTQLSLRQHLRGRRRRGEGGAGAGRSDGGERLQPDRDHRRGRA